MRNNNAHRTCGHLWCTLLLLVPRCIWSLPLVIGLLCPVTAQAAPDACYSVMGQSSNGTAIRLNDGCDLYRVVRALPLIDQETGKPYPTQIQLRSIFAANQDRFEDGTFVRRTVIRSCARPGKPDPHADKDELNNVCKNGDGLAHYFGIPGVKIVVPSKRQFTQAEATEAAQKQLDDEMSAKAAAQDKARQQRLDERRVEANAEALAKIKDLENKLSDSQAVVAELRGPANRGRWFWGLIIAIILLALYGVGSTTVAVRAKQPKPIITPVGGFFPDVTVASEILSQANADLQAELAASQLQVECLRKERDDGSAHIIQLGGELQKQAGLAEERFTALMKERSENRSLKERVSILEEEGERINGMFLRMEAENKDMRRPSFRPPGMKSEEQLRRENVELTESVNALRGVQVRQVTQIQNLETRLLSTEKRLQAEERIRKSVEYQLEQSIKSSRTRLRLVSSSVEQNGDDDAPTKVMDNPLGSPAVPQAIGLAAEARPSVPPPPMRNGALGQISSSENILVASSSDGASYKLSAEMACAEDGLSGDLKELAQYLDQAWHLSQERFEAKIALESVFAATEEIKAKLLETKEREVLESLTARLKGLNEKVVTLRGKWQSLVERETVMEKVGQETGFNRFQLRRHTWNAPEAEANQEAVVAGYRAAVEALKSVVEPEEIFVGMAEEMSALKSENKMLRGSFEELETVWRDNADLPKSSFGATLDERVRHVVGTLSDVIRQWVGAAKQPKAPSSAPPPQTISDIVRVGAIAGQQVLGDFGLANLQKALAEGPSYLVADSIKVCVREWAQRVLREGERVLTVYTNEELYDLNSFLCSPLIGGSNLDLKVTIGRALDGHKVHHAAETSCKHPSLRPSAEQRAHVPTMPPIHGYMLADAVMNRKNS